MTWFLVGDVAGTLETVRGNGRRRVKLAEVLLVCMNNVKAITVYLRPRKKQNTGGRITYLCIYHPILLGSSSEHW